MWKRTRPSKATNNEVVALVDHRGILVAGPTKALDEVVGWLTSYEGIRSRSVVDEVGSIASMVMSAKSIAPAETIGQYVKLSPDSADLLHRYGAIPGEPGYFRMFVHDSSKRIAGQLQWQPVSVGAEQALSLQMTAVSLALRAAIADVQRSIDRIETKLDQVTRLLRAKRLGDALGDHRTLSNLTERVRKARRISSADWQTVTGMGPQIARDLEGLRAHVLTLLERDDPSRTPWGRAEEVDKLLSEDWLEETLALLAVVEHNFSMWQELRIAHVEKNEPDHLTDTIADARQQLETQTEADQRVLDALIAYATVVADPRLLDGLDPYNSKRLSNARDGLDAVVQWFAGQRLLDATPLAEEAFPRFRESIGHLAGSASRVAGEAGRALRKVARRRPDRRPALESSDPNPPND